MSGRGKGGVCAEAYVQVLVFLPFLLQTEQGRNSESPHLTAQDALQPQRTRSQPAEQHQSISILPSTTITFPEISF